MFPVGVGDRDSRQNEQDERDWAGEEDPQGAIRNDQGLAQGLLHQVAQDHRQNDGRGGNVGSKGDTKGR